MDRNILGVEITRPNQELIIMRGVSGSGKSTMAKQLVGEGIIHSTDALIEATGDYKGFFQRMVESGDSSEHSKMHRLNLENAKRSLFNGKSPVIIDNTNLRPIEPKAYVKFGLDIGLSEDNIRIVDLGNDNQSSEVLSERNTHGVPLEVIDKMVNRHRTFGELTVETILDAKEKPLYCAVVLDKESKDKLLTVFSNRFGDDWKTFCHHMTIRFGNGLPESLKDDLDYEVSIRATHFGESDMAMAVRVAGYPSNNEIPHITLAVNVNEGGKPVMSNNITEWEELDSPIELSGVVKEIHR